jgi:hypothetical protein
MSVAPQADGPAAMWEITLQSYQSTPVAQDDFTIVFD